MDYGITEIIEKATSQNRLQTMFCAKMLTGRFCLV